MVLGGTGLFGKTILDSYLKGNLEKYNISKLDIRRIYRYLDKNVKKENTTLTNDDLEDEEEIEEEIE